MLKARYHDERLIFLGNVVIFNISFYEVWKHGTISGGGGEGGTNNLPEYLILPRKSIMFAHCIFGRTWGGSGEEENYVTVWSD